MTDQPTDDSNEMALAYSYVRYSTKGQIKGDSLRRQTELSDKFARDHNFRIVKNYHDLGVSGFKGKQKTDGALGLFIQDVEAGKIVKGSVLLVESLDRISREKPRVALQWFLNVLNLGIKVATVTDKRIYDPASVNEMDLFGSLLIMSRANEESERKSKLIRESWIGRRKKGIKGAVCPSWLYLDEKGEYQPNERRVKIVKDIFDWTITGIGAYTIARMLNDRAKTDDAYKPWKNVVGKEAKSWHPTTVYNILTNRAVLGLHQPGAVQDGEKVKIGEEVAGYYPQVIDEDVWLRAQAARKRSTAGAKGTMLTNLFGDKAECVHCKSNMRIKTSQIPKSRKDGGNAYRYFICSSAQAKTGCEETGYFNYEEVEKAVLDHVPEYKLHEIFAKTDEGSEIQNTDKEIGAIAFRLGELEKRQERMVLELSRTEPDDPLLDVFKKNLREVVSEIRKSKEKMDGLLELKAEIEAQQDHRGDAEAVIRKLREDLEDTSLSDDDKYKLRSRLSAALQSFIDFVWFDMQEETFDVVLMGGMIVHKFRKSVSKGRGRLRTIEYVGSVDVSSPLVMGGHMVRESFTNLTRDDNVEGEDPERVELFNRLNRRSAEQGCGKTENEGSVFPPRLELLPREQTSVQSGA